jgi:hypothetical protein
VVHHSGGSGGDAEGKHLAGAVESAGQVLTISGGLAFVAAVENGAVPREGRRDGDQKARNGSCSEG